MQLYKSLTLSTALKIIAISTLPVFLVWLPFIAGMTSLVFLTIPEPNMLHILRNWDGPHYIVVARAMYDMEETARLLFTDVPASYYPAHFPLYPIAIALLAPLFGFFYAGIAVNIGFGILLNLLFYHIAREHTKQPLLLTFVFTVFPARFFVTRTIVAPETMMVFFILLSLHLWEKRHYAYASVAGGLSIITKIKGGFLLPAFLAETIEHYLTYKTRISPARMWILLMPIFLVALGLFFYVRTGDIFAFLHAEKENQLFFSFPFAQFNSRAPWIGTAWLEDVLFYLFFMMVLVVKLSQSTRNRSWFFFSLFYTCFLIFVPQRDITRFSYPLYPLFLLTFAETCVSRRFVFALILILPAVYMFTINFILQNQAPIANYAPFL